MSDVLHTIVRVSGYNAFNRTFRAMSRNISDYANAFQQVNDIINQHISNLNRATTNANRYQKVIQSFQAKINQWRAEANQYLSIANNSKNAPASFKQYLYNLHAQNMQQIANATHRANIALGKYRNQLNIANSARAFLAANDSIIGRLRLLAKTLGITLRGAIFAVISAFAVLASSIVAWSIQIGAQFTKWREQLSQMFGSNSAGEAALNWSKKFAQSGKADIQSVVDAFGFLTRVEIQPTIDIMNTLADVAAMTKRYTMADVAKSAAYAIQMNQWERLQETIGIHKRQVIELAPQAFTTGDVQTAQIKDRKAAWDAIMKLMRQQHFKGAAERMAEKTPQGQWTKFIAEIQSIGDALSRWTTPLVVNFIKIVRLGFVPLRNLLLPILTGFFMLVKAASNVVLQFMRITDIVIPIKYIAGLIGGTVLTAFMRLASAAEALARALKWIADRLQDAERKAHNFILKFKPLKDIFDWLQRVGNEYIPHLGSNAFEDNKSFNDVLEGYKELFSTLQDIKRIGLNPSEILIEFADQIGLSKKAISNIKAFQVKELQDTLKLELDKIQSMKSQLENSDAAERMWNKFPKESEFINFAERSLTLDQKKKISDELKSSLEKVWEIRKKILSISMKEKDLDKQRREIIGGGDLAKAGIKQWELWKRVGNKISRTVESPRFNVRVDVEGEGGLEDFVRQISTQIINQTLTYVMKQGKQAFGQQFSF